MSTLYHQSIPVFVKFLRNASKLLEKAVVYADEKGLKHEEILTFRLRDDMRPLPYQIQSLSNTAKFFLPRVLLLPDTKFIDDETTFPQLQERITTTIKLLESVDLTTLDIEKLAKEEVIMKTGVGSFQFESGQIYLSEFAIPNFHFHLSTAYCILRHLGVPIGAFDYLGGIGRKI